MKLLVIISIVVGNTIMHVVAGTHTVVHTMHEEETFRMI